MSVESSTMFKLGTHAPAFRLPDVVSGKTLTIESQNIRNATVVMFICNHCPYVKHVVDGIVELANDYIPKNVHFIAISSNDVLQYPQDGPEKMKELALNKKFPFPYLYDETQDVARTYDAQCTPEFYVFDHDLKMVYHGQLDDARPSNNIPVSGKDVRNALDNLLTGKKISTDQKPGVGCSIKWKN